MADFGLNDIIDEASRLSSQGSDFTSEIVRLTQERSSATRETAGLATELGQLSADIQEKRELAILKARRQAQANARALGTDSSASSAIVADVNSKIRQDLLTFNQASQQLQEMDANDNLLANPLGWFNSLMNRQEISAVAEQTLNRLETNTAMLQRMHQLTQSDVQTNLALAETSDADTIQKKSRQQLLVAQIEANKARVEAAGYDMEGMQALERHGNSEFNRRIQLYNAQRNAYEFEESRKLQQQNLALQRSRIEAMQGQLEADNFIAERVNQAATMLGLSPLPKEVITSQFGKNTPIGQQIGVLANSGVISYQKGSAFIGGSPFEAKLILDTTGGRLPQSASPEIGAAFNYADTKLEEIRVAVQQLMPGSPGTEGTDFLDAKSIDDPNAISKVYNKYFNEFLSGVDASLGDNLSIQVQALENRFPQIKNTELYKTVLEPLSVSTASPVSIKQLGEYTAAHVQRGDISPEVASKELADISETVFNNYRATNGRLLVGAMLPSEQNFQIKLPVGKPQFAFNQSLGMIQSVRDVRDTITVNPANSTDWNSYFQRVLVESRSKNIEKSLRDSFNATGAEQ